MRGVRKNLVVGKNMTLEDKTLEEELAWDRRVSSLFKNYRSSLAVYDRLRAVNTKDYNEKGLRIYKKVLQTTLERSQDYRKKIDEILREVDTKLSKNG